VSADLAPQALEVWERFLEAHSAISRELERDLAEHHGLTLSDYDVLVQLQRQARRGLRPVELSRAVLLTRSGMTRLLAGLVQAGLVERLECPEDRRGSYVRITEAGRAALRKASRTHLARVDELFASRFDEEDLDALGVLLDRLPRPARPPLARVLAP
jgi:DNA-binding MarR family transcriptional regulator